MFISFLCMFRTTTCPSSGETTVFMRHLILVIPYGWLSTLHTRQSSVQNNKYQMSHKYSCFSWWWTHSRPKHVQKRNKYTKKYCGPSWLYLQDYLANVACTKIYTYQRLLYLLHVSVRHGFHLQGVFSVANATHSKWPSRRKWVRAVTRIRTN